jgi:hypothetical protein
MGALATVEELAVFMRLPTDTIDTDAAQAALDGASALVRDELGQALDYIADDVAVIRSRGGRCLALPELPVIDVTLVRVRLPAGEYVELTEGADYEADLAAGVLWRIGNTLSVSTAGDFGNELLAGEWPRSATFRGPNGWIEVTYSHGYAVPFNIGTGGYSDAPTRLPESISTIIKRVAARGYHNPEAVSQETAGRFSTVVYGRSPGLYLSDEDKAALPYVGSRGGAR